MEEQQRIQLLALDVDGTLFGTDGKVTPASVEAIRRAQEKGVQVVLASGRDYDGLPWNQLKDVQIDYVITTNGSAVYRTKDRKCLKEECLDKEKMIPLFEYILSKEVYLHTNAVFPLCRKDDCSGLCKNGTSYQSKPHGRHDQLSAEK